ncbi:MAG: aldehyde dehydrogenase family protein, partial [Flavobacteriaceae bacterium]
DEFANLMVEKTKKLKIGNGLDDGVQLGPMTTAKRLSEIEELVENEEENKRLEAFQYLIVSLEEIAKHTHVYKGEVARLTSNAVVFDIRLNKWRINPMSFR